MENSDGSYGWYGLYGLGKLVLGQLLERAYECTWKDKWVIGSMCPITKNKHLSGSGGM